MFAVIFNLIAASIYIMVVIYMKNYKDKLEADLGTCRGTLRALENETVISDNMRLRIKSTLHKISYEASYPLLPQILCFFHWHAWEKKSTRSLILYGLYRECTRCGRIENVMLSNTSWKKVTMEDYLKDISDGNDLSEKDLVERENIVLKIEAKRLLNKGADK